MQFVLTKPSSIGSGSHYRDVRKVYLSPEILKVNRLCTGDVVAIKGDDTTVSCRSRITNANMIQPSLNRILLLVSLGLPFPYPRNVSNRGFVKLHTHLMCWIKQSWCQHPSNWLHASNTVKIFRFFLSLEMLLENVFRGPPRCIKLRKLRLSGSERYQRMAYLPGLLLSGLRGRIGWTSLSENT